MAASQQTIWIFTELYYPEQTSTGYLLTQTAEGLAAEFDVQVITGPATNFYIRQKSPRREIRNGVMIYRCGGTSLNKDFLLRRLVNALTRTSSMLLKGLWLCRATDRMLVVTNPPLLPFAALVIKLMRRTPFVLLIHDVYPEALVAANLCSSDSVLVKLGGAANRWLYRQATAIVSLGRDMSRLIQAKLVPGDKRVRLIPNWAENEIVRPCPRKSNRLLEQLGIRDRFVVLYAGNIGKTHGIDCLAEAARRLQNDRSIHFVVLGFGARKRWLEEFAPAAKLDNITFVPPMPRQEQIVFLNACDVALITFAPGMAGVSVPSRMYSQMAAGKPIIAATDAESELAEVIREEDIGWVVAPGEPGALVEAIRQAAGDPVRLEEFGKNAHRAASTKYTFEAADRSYRSLFRELFEPSRSAR